MTAASAADVELVNQLPAGAAGGGAVWSHEAENPGDSNIQTNTGAAAEVFTSRGGRAGEGSAGGRRPDYCCRGHCWESLQSD